MAIIKQVYAESGSNAAAITASSWAEAYRVQISDTNRAKYGPFNMLELKNTSTEDGEIVFTDSFQAYNAGTHERVRVDAGESYSMSPDEGKLFYGFTFVNLDAANDMAIGEVIYRADVVKQIPEAEAR